MKVRDQSKALTRPNNFARLALFILAVICILLITHVARGEAPEAELKGACERGVACFASLACRPTIAKDVLPQMEDAKCYLDSKCTETLDAMRIARLQKLKTEFPPNDSNASFYERNVKARETDAKRLPSGF